MRYPKTQCSTCRENFNRLQYTQTENIDGISKEIKKKKPKIPQTQNLRNGNIYFEVENTSHRSNSSH